MSIDLLPCFLTLTMILAGEAPVGLMGEDAASAVAWTMRNRLEDWGWSCEQLAGAYYGRGRPGEGERRIIRQVFAAEVDPTEGGVFALSKQDVKRLGFPPGDLVFSAHGLEVHIYRVSPWRRQHDRTSLETHRDGL